MKTHARVRRATSKTPGSVVQAEVFLPSLRSAQFVIYAVDKGICERKEGRLISSSNAWGPWLSPANSDEPQCGQRPKPKQPSKTC